MGGRWARGAFAVAALVAVGTSCDTGDEADEVRAAQSTITTEASITTTTALVTTTSRIMPPTTAAPRTPAPTITTTTTVAAPAATSSCHASYEGVCLPPDAEDVDCPGGSGNGPVYAPSRNFRVVGPDEYDLDGNDNDGLACES